MYFDVSKGNLPLVAMCYICEEECDIEPGLTDWWCCWCQKCVHEACKSALSDVIINDIFPFYRYIFFISFAIKKITDSPKILASYIESHYISRVI